MEILEGLDATGPECDRRIHPDVGEVGRPVESKIRADVANQKIVAMVFSWAERAIRQAVVFCSWLAWCRFRVVLPLLGKTALSVFSAIDAALRRLGGVPTYLLTDNEKTITAEHVAGVPLRNPATVVLARHYGLTIGTCVPQTVIMLASMTGRPRASLRGASEDASI